MATNTPNAPAETAPTPPTEDKRERLKSDIAEMQKKMDQRSKENAERAQGNQGILKRLKTALGRPPAENVMEATLGQARPGGAANERPIAGAPGDGNHAMRVDQLPGVDRSSNVQRIDQLSPEQQARNARVAEMLNQTRANIDQAGADRRAAADRSPLTPAREGQAVYNDQTGRYETPRQQADRGQVDMSPIANPDGMPIGRGGQVEPGQPTPVRPIEVRAGQVGTPNANEGRPQYTPEQRNVMNQDRARLNEEQAAIKQRIEQHNEQPGDQQRAQQVEKQLNDLNREIGRDSAQRIDQARAEAPRPASQTAAAKTEGTVSPNAPDAEFAHTVQSGLKIAEQAVAEDAAREDLVKIVESGRKIAEQAAKDDADRKAKQDLEHLAESGKKIAEWARQDDANREQIFADMNKEPTQEEVDKVAHQIWENRMKNNTPGDALADQDAARKQIAREREEAKKKHLESRPPGSPQPAEQPKDTSTERSGGGGGGGGGGGRAAAESLIDAVAAVAGAQAENGSGASNNEADQTAAGERKNGNETAEVAELKKEVAELKKLLAEQRQQMQEMATLIAALAEKNGIDKNKLGQLAKGLGLMSILALLGVTVSGMSRGMGGR